MQSLYQNTPYLFNLLAIQTLVVSLGVILLGVVALIREQGSHVSVVYFVLTLSIGIWLFAFSWMYCAADAQLAMWWAKVGYVGIAFIPPAIIHFSSLITQDYERVRKRVLTTWILSAVFITLIITTDIQFKSLYHYWFGFYPDSGKTSLPFLLYFFGAMIFALRSFVADYRSSIKGSVRQKRLRTLLLAFGFGYLASFDFATSYGMPLYPVGYVPMLFFLIISARYIFRYRFMEITPSFAARQIIDTMNDALILLDPDGVVRLVNRATCDLFNCREGDLVGKQVAAGTVGDIAFFQKIDSDIRSGMARNHEVDYQPREGMRHTLSVSTAFMRNPAGEPLATVCVVNDMTERKQAEEDREKLVVRLQSANQKLQAIDKMKSDFVSVVSHELRTPLTTIKAFVELVIMKPYMLGPQRTKFMYTINNETDRLGRLITDLLDIARIEAGSMKWRADHLSVAEVIRDAIISLGPLFENKGLLLTTSMGSPLSTIPGDRDRLVQVVTNILSNAVKFTPRGGTIHIAARQEANPTERIIVEISDTGMGIPAEDLELIFEKFQRSGDQLTSTVEGTGLGLAISRQIIEHHGGKIWATSTRGKGSTFTFTLPLAERVEQRQ